MFKMFNKAYESYLSEIMKQSLLEQFRLQPTFNSILWRNDIFDYFVSSSCPFLIYLHISGSVVKMVKL